jgi:nicotinamide mononucleotide (NMN) deamidase PncC
MIDWQEQLKQAGVSIHIAATGAGAGLQQLLWAVPGSSAYLSGSSFPYAAQEQEQFLGFMPEHFCCQEAAADLASAAYIKAFKFGGNKPIGLGITASVASEKEHRGEHRAHFCIITDDKALDYQLTIPKGSGSERRLTDGETCDAIGHLILLNALGITPPSSLWTNLDWRDATQLVEARFWSRPFFAANGQRSTLIPKNKEFAMLSGAFNPPHAGHLGMADAYEELRPGQTVFEISATTPHKAPLTVQDMLKRSSMLMGRNRLFTNSLGMYLDKAKAFPGMPFLIGADAAQRLFDPKWGIPVRDLLTQFHNLGTTFYVAERMTSLGLILDHDCIIDNLIDTYHLDNYDQDMVYDLLFRLPGRWDISSTSLREAI